MYLNEPIRKYLDELAARQPTPGGGSAAGLCGAVGTALLEMVCNFTLGNEKYKDVSRETERFLVSLKEIHAGFSALIDEDVKAYSSIRGAFKTKDKKIIDKALKDGYDICLKICELSNKALVVAQELPDKSNINLITDVGCGAELLNAAFNSGIFNCEINLKGMEDKAFVGQQKEILDALRSREAALYQGTISKTKERMG